MKMGLTKMLATLCAVGGLAWLSVMSTTAVFAQDKADKAERPKPPVRAADSDAPLAEGWPGGTAPGKIEVKEYPAYRSAVASAKEVGLRGGLVDGILFMSLFNHIDRNSIAMTTPVVNTYTPVMVEQPNARGEMTMEFVYRSQKLGSLGAGSGAVKVVDHPACTYVCLGVQGGMDNKELVDGVAQLKAWIAEHKSEWVQNGNPRRLGYHGPMTPNNQKLWEVQIPIVSAKTPANAKPTPAPAAKPSSTSEKPGL